MLEQFRLEMNYFIKTLFENKVETQQGVLRDNSAPKWVNSWERRFQAKQLHPSENLVPRWPDENKCARNLEAKLLRYIKFRNATFNVYLKDTYDYAWAKIVIVERLHQLLDKDMKDWLPERMISQVLQLFRALDGHLWGLRSSPWSRGRISETQLQPGSPIAFAAYWLSRCPSALNQEKGSRGVPYSCYISSAL